jgi:hypothetical protein
MLVRHEPRDIGYFNFVDAIKAVVETELRNDDEFFPSPSGGFRD